MHPLIALAGAGGDPPLIDLDNTVFLQLGIFLIAALVLNKLLFKPYLAMRDAREQGIDGARDAARRMEEEARAKVADYEGQLARAKAKAAEERMKLRTEAAERERAITEAARTETQSVLEQARQRLDADAKAARAAMEPRTQEIARAIAKKVLGRDVA